VVLILQVLTFYQGATEGKASKHNLCYFDNVCMAMYGYIGYCSYFSGGQHLTTRQVTPRTYQKVAKKVAKSQFLHGTCEPP